MYSTLYQEPAVFGKMKMDPTKRAQTQNAGEVSFLQWVFSQSVELMTDKVGLICCWRNTFTTDTLRSCQGSTPPQHKTDSSVHTGRFDRTSPDT